MQCKVLSLIHANGSLNSCERALILAKILDCASNGLLSGLNRLSMPARPVSVTEEWRQLLLINIYLGTSYD